MKYQPVIGLEIHCQLKTKSKMFCGCANTQTDEPNINICPVCLGMPGALPVANKQAIEWTILVGQALNSSISTFAKFDRKNYFYPDLPKGYQISQYDLPFCQRGFLDIEVPTNQYKSKTNITNIKRIRIRRVHLEEDTAKMIHKEGEDASLVDFNRSGVPLMEIVTEPDLSSPVEARIFMQSLQQILRYLEISDADMEKGQLRCDANISLTQKSNLSRRLRSGLQHLSLEKTQNLDKVEIKNMNSFRAIEKALSYEIERQTEILESRGKVKRETRGWDEAKGKTVSQRSKEEVHDYRYFPEPDLPPVLVTSDKQQVTRDKINLEEIKAQIPELPKEKKERFMKEYGLSNYDADVLTNDKPLAEFYENICSELLGWEKIAGLKDGAEFKKLAKVVANWVSGEFLKLLTSSEIKVKNSKITPENFAELIIMLAKETISQPAAKQIFNEMFKTGEDPSTILQDKGLHLVTDTQILENVITEVVKNNPKAVADYKKGRQQALKFLLGQVMARTKRAAEPNLVQELLTKKLK